MTYAELVQQVKDYLENKGTTFTGNIDLFIRLAEERIVRAVKHPVFRANQTSAFTVGDKLISKPTGFLAPYHMKILTAPVSFMIPVEPGFIEEAYPDDSYTGRPRYYSSRDNSTFLVGPVPDVAYPVGLAFYKTPDSIVDTSPSWIGTNASNALLYGTLSEAYRFMKGETELHAMYEGMFTNALIDLGNIGSDRHAFDEYLTQIESI